ncbi:hypothetical protein MWU50_08825 [Flavobacteriaceae bacterium S0862]|nr:hypothetical protein [Flavobacteriaceae bacterium S0862]
MAAGTIDAGPTNDIVVSALNDTDILRFSNNSSGTFTGHNTKSSQSTYESRHHYFRGFRWR